MQATASRSMAPSAAMARPTQGAARSAFKANAAPAAIAKSSFARKQLVQRAARVQSRSYVVVRAADDKASRALRLHASDLTCKRAEALLGPPAARP